MSSAFEQPFRNSATSMAGLIAIKSMVINGLEKLFNVVL